MSSIDEKRVYGDRAGKIDAHVAADVGVLTVSVSGGMVGEFGVARRCDARDVAAPESGVAVAAAEDVFVGGADGFEATGFGESVAVAGTETPLAAGPDGRVARLDGDGWTDLGAVDATVEAADGTLLATDDGVYRADGDGLRHLGLAAASDVSAPGAPHAATASGLFRLDEGSEPTNFSKRGDDRRSRAGGEGWSRVREGEFRVVAADPATTDGRTLGRAHAATADALYAHDAGAWTATPLPEAAGTVAGVAYGEGVYAVTADGAFLADAGDGWRSTPLGVPDARAVAVAPAPDS